MGDVKSVTPHKDLGNMFPESGGGGAVETVHSSTQVMRCPIRYPKHNFTAVTMKSVVFWDIKTQFVPHRRHITSPLQSSAG
jgi:hypothetical protein